MNIKTTNWLPGLIIFLLAGFLILTHIRLYQYAFDDAFIHFRVVRNLFETGYPYYNANDMLKVSTSSGWIVCLTALFGIANLFKVENSFPLLVSITNALISLGGAYVYTKIVENLLKNPLSISKKLLFQILFVILLLPTSIGLMETPLALLIAGLGIYFLLLSKPSGFALLGFAAYIRLELSILVVLIILFVIVQKQFRLHQIIGYGILGALPFVFYDLYFFHTVIPHSIIAKAALYSLTPLDSLLFIINSLPVNLNFGVTTIIFLSLITMTSWATFREKKAIKSLWPLLFCLWGLGIIGAYIVGHAFVFDWYKPLYTIPILVACFVCSFSIKHPSNIVIRIPLFVLLLLSVISITETFYASIYDPSAFVLFETGSRVKTYLRIGKILNDEYPNATLLSSEIGGLGYSFKGKILDAGGLASSDASAFHPMKVPEQRANGAIGAIPPGYVKMTMPDIIVSYDGFAQALLSDAIINQYNIIVIPAYLPEDAIYSESKMIWGSKYLRVYIRKTLPVSERIYALGQ